jgi:hypothetical protein
MPMLIVTIVAEIVFIITLLLGPETKGQHLVSDIILGQTTQPLPRIGTAD